jgi:hypothetical protein
MEIVVFLTNLGDFKMKLNTFLVVPAILSALLLSACGEKATEATDAAAGAATEALDAAAGAATDAATDAATATVEAAGDAAAAATEAAPAAADTAGGGGYEPTAEERIPGETRP